MFTYSRITPHILRYPRRLADCVAQIVSVDTGVRRRLSVAAGSAVVHELVVEFVFLGVEEVGAFVAEAEGDFLGGFGRELGIAGGGRGHDVGGLGEVGVELD